MNLLLHSWLHFNAGPPKERDYNDSQVDCKRLKAFHKGCSAWLVDGWALVDG